MKSKETLLKKQLEATGRWPLENIEFHKWFKGNQILALWCLWNPYVAFYGRLL
jgi:hypothetical protein